MKTIFQMSVLAAVSLAVASLPANAQNKCPEGTTASGECVDPGIAVSSRLSAVILSQPKISYTAYPVLPSGDLDYRYPNQLNPNQQLPAPTGIPIPPNP
ncbi:MAG: hypothetical protein ACXWJW_03680 [Xanthobacteraceae bacterium]